MDYWFINETHNEHFNSYILKFICFNILGEKMKTKAKVFGEDSVRDSYNEGPADHKIDLNVLLRRAKEEEKNHRKTNWLIFSSVALATFVVVLIFNL